MMKERISPYRAQETAEVSRLAEWFDKHGIKAVLFDLDDTILDTYALHKEKEDAYLAYVASRLPQIPKEAIAGKLQALDREAFGSHSVSRERLHAVVAHLAEAYGLESASIFYDGKPIIMSTYETAPEFLPGAMITLQTFRQAAEKLGVVTHADEAWTNLKLDQRDIRKYFDTVMTADPFKYKGPEDWKRAIDALGVRPEHVLVIGDNLNGDVRAAQSVGVKYAVWIPSPWTIYNEGEVPEDVIRANQLSSVIPTLLNQF